MTDLALRTLERDAAAGDPEAEVRLLIARVRADDLHLRQLVLAAGMGHAGSRAVLGPKAPRPWTFSAKSSRQLWKRLLRQVGKVPAALVAESAARVAQPHGTPLPMGTESHVHFSFRCVLAWCVCPCVVHREQVGEVAMALYAARNDAYDRAQDWQYWTRGGTKLISAVLAMNDVVSEKRPTYPSRSYEALLWAREVVSDAEGDVEALDGEIRRTLIAWALA